MTAEQCSTTLTMSRLTKTIKEQTKKSAPPGWTPEYEKEPVVFYKYTGKATNESLEDFINRMPESKGYFAAQKMRDDQIGGKEE